MRDANEHYRALVAEWFTGPVCLTFSHGIGVDRAAAAFGDLGTGRSRTYREAIEAAYEPRQAAGIGCTAIAGELGEWRPSRRRPSCSASA
ncbi:hypothetical protein ACBJ59_46110 [Nonomuraea sp. MTCD27]|uniref:hypothetical protein n=1 Tax=Nonomuraea sp. MTCD27 TaxID=1676747 RepID=UPI0035BF43FE